jgi:tyrosinase
VDVGGPTGLMSAFDTAPLDPIFWLHHCNIDRLWEVWRNLANTELPTVTPWLDFTFPIGTGAGRIELAVADVQHTTRSPLFYRYDGVAVPPIPAPPGPAGPAGGALREKPMKPLPPPRLVGATDDPVKVGAKAGRATISVTPLARPAGAAGPAGGGAIPRLRTYLTLENITGSGTPSGVYVVTVRPPPGAGPNAGGEREIGRFSTFGLAEASRPDGDHAGSGLAYSFDVTDLVSELGLVDAAAGEPKLDVAVVPARRIAGKHKAGELSIGKIGIYQE